MSPDELGAVIAPTGLGSSKREQFWCAVVLHAGISYQLLAGLIWIGLWVHLGASHYALALGVIVAGCVAILLDWLVARERLVAQDGHWMLLARLLFFVGFLCFLFVGSLLIGAITYVSRETMIVFVIIPLFIVGLWHLARLTTVNEALEIVGASMHNEFAIAFRWVMVCWAIVFVPVLIGWGVASWALGLVHDEGRTVRAWLDSNERKQAACPRWEVGGKKVVVALALSGGGYRAALTHSGVAAALDEKCITVQLLSTVSGGSIFGTSYALGVPPAEFARRLAAQKPGLANELVKIATVASVLMRRRTQNDVYRDHFHDVFFGDRRLSDLGGGPHLLINVTNVYPASGNGREILLKGHGPVEVEQLQLADAVAASGAFPGAFTLRPVRWFEELPHAFLIGDHFLIDGGVVENVGTEGLRHYLRSLSWMEWKRVRPDILIVSDASGYSRPVKSRLINPTAVELLSGANNLQFDMLHRLLYAELTGERDAMSPRAERPAWQQFYKRKYPASFMPESARSSEEHILRTIVIPMAAELTGRLLSRYPECAAPKGLGAAAVHDRVSMLNTLDELGPADAKDAFWVGFALGTIYADAIECARRELAGEPCKEPPSPRPLDCSAALLP